MNRHQSERYIHSLLEELTPRDAWEFLTDLFLLLCFHARQPAEKPRSLLREVSWGLAVREAAQYTGLPLLTNRNPLSDVSLACLKAVDHMVKQQSESPDSTPAELSALLESLLWEMVRRRLIRDFITPPFLADMMAQMLDPRPGCTILDPACGSGGLLLAAQTQCPGCLPAGVEISRPLAAAAALRLQMSGGTGSNVQREDFFNLAPGMEGQWDAVLSNPPYNGDPSDTARFIFGFLQVLKPRGRCVILVPEGFLSSTARARANAARRFLLKYHTLEAVVSLPPEIYAPQLTSHSSILIFRKDREEVRRDVFFSRVLREEDPGRAPGDAYLPGIRRVLDFWRRWSAGTALPGPEEPAWWTVSHEELARGGAIFPAEGGASPYAAHAFRGEALRRAEERQSALESLLSRYIGGTE